MKKRCDKTRQYILFLDFVVLHVTMLGLKQNYDAPTVMELKSQKRLLLQHFKLKHKNLKTESEFSTFSFKAFLC